MSTTNDLIESSIATTPEPLATPREAFEASLRTVQGLINFARDETARQLPSTPEALTSKLVDQMIKLTELVTTSPRQAAAAPDLTRLEAELAELRQGHAQILARLDELAEMEIAEQTHPRRRPTAEAEEPEDKEGLIEEALETVSPARAAEKLMSEVKPGRKWY